MSYRILVADPEPSRGTPIAERLSREGFEVPP